MEENFLIFSSTNLISENCFMRRKEKKNQGEPTTTGKHSQKLFTCTLSPSISTSINTRGNEGLMREFEKQTYSYISEIITTHKLFTNNKLKALSLYL